MSKFDGLPSASWSFNRGEATAYLDHFELVVIYTGEEFQWNIFDHEHDFQDGGFEDTLRDAKMMAESVATDYILQDLEF